MGYFNNVFNALIGQNELRPNNLNPKFEEFKDLSKEDEDAIRKSVIEQYFKGEDTGSFQTMGYDYSRSYSEFVYGSVNTSKQQRLNAYRKMGNFPEVSNAIDEICDAMLNYNDNDNLIELTLRDPNINSIKVSELEEQFKDYTSLLDLEYNFFDYCRTLVIDGELAFENVIDDENEEAGIIGLNIIPNESYDFMIDPISFKKEGIMVTIDNPNKPNTSKDMGMGGGAQGNIHVQSVGDYRQQQQQDKNKQRINQGESEDIVLSDKEGIPLPWDQITYIDSGMYNPSKMIVYPVLEKARKSYRQLALIEDAIIIYRLVRAPERLIFNVDTGKMNRAKAEQEVYKLMKRYQTKQFYNPITGSVSNDYDPHAILENFWFPRPEGSQGTTVTSIAGSTNWTELPDLEYFQKKLWLALKIPYNRFLDPSINVDKSTTINYEEYRFAKFVMRLQDRFAIGIAKGFITHLKLIGLWDRYELKEQDIKVNITPPASYDLYERQKLLQVKFDNQSTGSDSYQ